MSVASWMRPHTMQWKSISGGIFFLFPPSGRVKSRQMSDCGLGVYGLLYVVRPVGGEGKTNCFSGLCG